MKRITVVVTAHNEDYSEINATVSNIISTAGNRVNIIFVDDASPMPVSLQNKVSRLIRLDERAGVAGARHVAMSYVDTEFALITDAHVRFEPGWPGRCWDAMIKGRSEDDFKSTIFCGTCVALSKQNMDMAQAKSEYNGATIRFYGQGPHGPEIIEGKWVADRPGDDHYPLPGIMGACYLMTTDWFFQIGGLRLLRGWGGDEPFLALKTWLAGGECRMLKSLRVGHQFRDGGPYRTETWQLWYNRLAIIHTCIPDPWKQKLLDAFPTDGEVATARRKIAEDANHIAVERAYYTRIFTRKFEDYLKAFGIEFGL